MSKEIQNLKGNDFEVESTRRYNTLDGKKLTPKVVKDLQTDVKLSDIQQEFFRMAAKWAVGTVDLRRSLKLEIDIVTKSKVT
jgi:hypothetical protein